MTWFIRFLSLALPVFLVLTPAAPVDAQTPRVISMTGNDALQFSVKAIEANPGEPLQVMLETISRMPKEVMAHNFVLLASDTDVQGFINASALARRHAYVAPAFQDQVLADSGLAGAGETVESTFDSPAEPGEYIYVCSFPGHYAGGMWGTLTVK